MRLFLHFIVLIIGSLNSFAQIGIGTNNPHQSAIVEVQSTNQGVLIPRLTNSQMNNITGPTNGLLVYNTDESCIYMFSDSWKSLCQASTTPTPPVSNTAIDFFEPNDVSDINGDFGAATAQSDDGNLLVVSAPAGDNNGVQGVGFIIIFERSGNTYVEKQKIVRPIANHSQTDRLGYRLSISSDAQTIAAALLDDSGSNSQTDNSETNSGAVMIYQYDSVDDEWKEQAFIKAPSPNQNENFGSNISLSSDGNFLTVGVPGRTVSGSANVGQVFTYTRTGSSWSSAPTNTLVSSTANANEFFGFSVAISDDGNNLAVGATGGQFVEIFTKSGNSWNFAQRVTNAATDPGDAFGYAISLDSDGDVLAVIAVAEKSLSQTDETDNSAGTTAIGAAYIFKKNGNSWEKKAYLKHPNPTNFSILNVDLSGTGKFVILGCPNDRSADANDPSSDDGASYGAVLVFGTVDDENWIRTNYLKAPTPTLLSTFGASARIASNGSSIIVGATRDTKKKGGGATTQFGAVYFYQ